MLLDQALNKVTAVDMTAPFQLLSILCGCLLLYVMQQTWNDRMSQGDPHYLQIARRLAYIVLALAIFWRVSFLDTRSERPSAPEVLLIIALTLMFFVRATLLHRARLKLPPPLPRTPQPISNQRTSRPF